MEEESKSGGKIFTTILIVIFLIGLGFGGYFLGQYLDAMAAKKQAEQRPTEFTYSNDTLKIKFKVPADWIKDESINADSSFVSFKNKEGSQFIYSQSNTADVDIQVCDEADPEGSAEGIEACTFISGGKIKFARYKEESTNSAEVGDTWIILEPAEVTNPGKYLVDRTGFFYYVSKSDKDLTTLDNIMKTVERL